MREIQLKDAKAKLSSVIDDAMNGDGAIITRHGRKDAVVISYAEFERLKIPCRALAGCWRTRRWRKAICPSGNPPAPRVIRSSDVSAGHEHSVCPGLRAKRRPARQTRSGLLVNESENLFISTISIAEIEAGIAKLYRQEATRKAGELSVWIDRVLKAYRDRIVPLDIAAARIAGRLLDKAIGAGGDPDFEDAAIAACATVANMTVMTRNARHFHLFDVPHFDPYRQLPEQNG